MVVDPQWLLQPAPSYLSRIQPAIANLLIWWLAIVSECALLIRGVQTGGIKKYSFFYGYVAILFLTDSVMYGVSLSPYYSQFDAWQWRAEIILFVSVQGIFVETIRHALSPDRFPAGFVKTVRRFLIAFSVVFAIIWLFSASRPIEMEVVFERNMTFVESTMLLLAVGTIVNYEIPLGINLKGMLIGYGFCLVSDDVITIFRYRLGLSFDQVWLIVQPLCTLTELVIWAVCLWNIYPTPAYNPSSLAETRADVLARRVKYKLASARAFCTNWVRP